MAQNDKKAIKKVQIRGGFSDRNHINEISKIIQTNSFDERTRTQLYNNICFIINEDEYLIDLNNVYLDILDNVYCDVVENYDTYSVISYIATCKRYIKDTFLYDTYDSILSLIEYVVNRINSKINPYDRQLIYDNNGNVSYFNEYEHMNKVFETECVGYRFVDKKIVEITDKNEIEEIEQACKNPYEGCQTHIKKAVGFLADREHKDYKNCIKESISAVESICQIITKNSKATLGQALKILKDKGVNIHPSLESAFSKLYGYTSNEGGIRHCDGMFESNVTFEDAKFMLVSCSAFVNYLIAEYGKIKGN